ncbi:MAG TPA: polysaccharide biosynthesis C-terminal domain-containing protein [Coriobacteriia bacterium]|nr:polysaccharide biosynthesis C-terminal domain-containing protein [Coriobacteriia bacterium]
MSPREESPLEEIELVEDVLEAHDQSAHEEGVRQAVKSAGADALRYAPVRFIPALIALVSIPIFTGAIPPAEYGAYFLVTSAATLVSSIAIGWLASAAVRHYVSARNEERLDGYMATVVWTALASLVAAALLSGAFVWLVRGSVSAQVLRLVPAALVFLVFNFITDVLSQVMRASRQASAFAFVQLLGSVSATAISIGLVLATPLGANGILLGGSAGWAIALVFILRNLASQASISPAHFSVPFARELLAYGLPLVPMSVASWALVFIDRYAVEFFRGSFEVGMYSVSYSLGERFMLLVTSPLLLTMAPSLIETYETVGEKVASGLQKQFVRYFALVTFPVLAGIASAAPAIMIVLTAPAYRQAWPVLPIVAAGSLLAGFSQVATSGLTLHKKTGVIMQNILVATAFNIAANILFIPVFGYIAAAWATLGAWLIMMVLSWWRSRSYMPLRVPWLDLTRVGGAALVMAAAVWGVLALFGTLPNRPVALIALVAAAVIGLAAYVGTAVALRAVSGAELSAVRRRITGMLQGRDAA